MRGSPHSPSQPPCASPVTLLTKTACPYRSSVCVCVCVCEGDSPPNSDGSVVRAVMGDGGAFKEAANPVQGLGRLSQRKGIPVLSSEDRIGHWAPKPRGERGRGILREEQIPCEKEKRERQAGEVSRGSLQGLGAWQRTRTVS